jgi:hypothetical protein
MVTRGFLRVLRIWALRVVVLTVHPENALYSTNDSANRSPHHGTDRAGTPVTFIDTVSNTARYSLRVRSQRNRECSNKRACNQNLSLH